MRSKRSYGGYLDSEGLEGLHNDEEEDEEPVIEVRGWRKQNLVSRVRAGSHPLLAAVAACKPRHKSPGSVLPSKRTTLSCPLHNFLPHHTPLARVLPTHRPDSSTHP